MHRCGLFPTAVKCVSKVNSMIDHNNGIPLIREAILRSGLALNKKVVGRLHNCSNISRNITLRYPVEFAVSAVQ